MGKKKSKNIEKNIKSEVENNSIAKDAKQLLVITLIVLLFLGGFYLITVAVLNDDTEKKDTEKQEVAIQFDEILIGRSFSLNDDTYYVLYYEFDDEEIGSDLASLVYNYRASNKDVPLYTVDMSNALNSAFLNDESNKEATKASELKISGPTLIKFVDRTFNYDKKRALEIWKFILENNISSYKQFLEVIFPNKKIGNLINILINKIILPEILCFS